MAQSYEYGTFMGTNYSVVAVNLWNELAITGWQSTHIVKAWGREGWCGSKGISGLYLFLVLYVLR